MNDTLKKMGKLKIHQNLYFKCFRSYVYKFYFSGTRLLWAAVVLETFWELASYIGKHYSNHADTKTVTKK